jgi:glycosylphosphatidylinositol deacylase
MFENPTYHRISMPKNIQILYGRYSLYSYCEGVLCDSHRRNQFSGRQHCFFFLILENILFFIFLGSPVLFIVGNADSYRQVRSLGSVAYRMGDKQKQLDYFSIDFNEELSALFGGVLEQQTEFLAYAIQKILSLYKIEKTIILVGNSIGGLLCRKIY